MVINDLCSECWMYWWRLVIISPNSTLVPSHWSAWPASNYNKTEFLKFLLKLCFQSQNSLLLLHDIFTYVSVDQSDHDSCSLIGAHDDL